MEVSVIIPVRNAAAFVRDSIWSALRQPETREVIIVDDGSTDPTVSICKAIAAEDNRVLLLRHRGGAHRGVSAARNLGIEHSTMQHVAFLDADDYYLPNRFAQTRCILEEYPDTDGVCEAIGTCFDSEEAERNWGLHGRPVVTGIRRLVEPNEFFEAQAPIGNAGHCSLDGLTVKRETLDRVGPFDCQLTMGEDTAFFMRMAACAQLRVGRIGAPVAVRRVHDNNTISRSRSPARVWNDRLKMWLSVHRWFRKTRPCDPRRASVTRRMVEDACVVGTAGTGTRVGPWRLILRCIGIVASCPRLACDENFLRGVVTKLVRTGPN